MGNWFDERAKSSARHSSNDPDFVGVQPVAGDGLSRRDVLKRGGIVAGVAWTAPMLLSVTPAAAAVTMCPDQRPPCDGVCCVPEDNCVQQDDGSFDCIPPGGLGGDCKNNGQGVSGCDQTEQDNGSITNIHCNGADDNICGGPGAQCDFDYECANPLTCNGDPGTNQNFCI